MKQISVWIFLSPSSSPALWNGSVSRLPPSAFQPPQPQRDPAHHRQAAAVRWPRWSAWGRSLHPLAAAVWAPVRREWEHRLGPPAVLPGWVRLVQLRDCSRLPVARVPLPELVRERAAMAPAVGFGDLPEGLSQQVSRAKRWRKKALAVLKADPGIKLDPIWRLFTDDGCCYCENQFTWAHSSPPPPKKSWILIWKKLMREWTDLRTQRLQERQLRLNHVPMATADLFRVESLIGTCHRWRFSNHPSLLRMDWLVFSAVCWFCLSGRCCRYRTVLGEGVHTDALFSSSSLRGLEESLFCPSGKRSSEPGSSWDAYWEHNEPLRDVDEVAVPVLSICARDDPIRGDTRSTVPLELFETNPHFFLLLTKRGGHCGFSTQREGGVLRACGSAGPAAPPNNQGTNWSHKALLEFFRATTDFFAAEDRAKQLAARRRGLGGSLSGKMFRHRSVSSCKRAPACSHNIHAIYSWQRSYTRWWSFSRILDFTVVYSTYCSLA